MPEGVSRENTNFKYYFDSALVTRIAQQIHRIYPEFDPEKFVQRVTPQLDALELKGRVMAISEGFRHTLPQEYPTAIGILINVLTDRLANAEGMFNNNFWVMPIAQFVEDYGIEHFEASFGAMYEITQHFTSEWAVRPFIQRYPEQVIAQLTQWIDDPSEHVRRWISEGTRPRLPWGKRVTVFSDDPTPTLNLLTRLKDDPSEFVRKSVANHLNDITKEQPERILDVLTAWNEHPSPEIRWITKHALRSLIKAGHPRALALVGIDPEQAVNVTAFTLDSEQVMFGNSISLSVTLHNPHAVPVDILLDYKVHYVKANGQTSPKVFKWTTRQLQPNETLTLTKKHALKPITTRVHYPGLHGVELQINGQVIEHRNYFELLIPR